MPYFSTTTDHRNPRWPGTRRHCGLLCQARRADSRRPGQGPSEGGDLGRPHDPGPDAGLIGNGPDPTPWLLRGADILGTAGATMLAIPCNTAHAFMPAISAHLDVPIVHMIDEVTKYIALGMPKVRTVGLLATTGTIRAGLYQTWFGAAGMTIVTPEERDQSDDVMPAIRAVKAGDATVTSPRTGPSDAALVDRGAEVVVAGCTEIPLGLPGRRPVSGDRPPDDPRPCPAEADRVPKGQINGGGLRIDE